VVKSSKLVIFARFDDLWKLGDSSGKIDEHKQY
jgi:hypothetical protein